MRKERRFPLLRLKPRSFQRQNSVTSVTLDSTFRGRLSHYLPSDLLNALPEPKAMAEAIRNLNSLQQTFASFLPLYVSENPDLLASDAGYLRSGTFMFADVSGFTALSERLQNIDGREGAEILTKIINDYFATMLEIIAKSTGTLLKFAGDALLAFFPRVGNEFESPKAIRAGLRMQRAMQRKFQPIQHALLNELIGDHDIELTMSIGVVQGQLFEAMIGNSGQRDHIIQGDLPRRADKAEEAGVRDEVIVDTALYELCRDEFEMVEVKPGFFQVVDNLGNQLDDFEFQLPRRRRAKSTALFGLEATDLAEDLNAVLERVEQVARFISPEVVNKLVVKGDHIESENRPATVMFVFFAGFGRLLEYWGEEQLDLVVSLLDRYYSLMQRVVSSKGGSLTRSDPYKEGSKLLITFGAPVAHEDDPDRAAATALEMQRQLKILNERIREELSPEMQPDFFPYIVQRMGISQGQVFAGEVGWRSRREYTVMGDDVNLAARLMGGGEMGQITISERVWQRVSRFFETEALPPRQFKGKSNPLPVFLVKGEKQVTVDVEKTSDTPFIGRDTLLLTLTLALEQARGPRRRRLIAVYGDAGIGKTRIGRKLAHDAMGLDFTVAWSTGRSQDDHRSTWSSLIAQLLGFPDAEEEEERRLMLEVALDELKKPELLSLLSDLLRGYVGDPNIQYVEEETKSDISDMFRTNLYERLERASPSNPTGIFRMVDGVLHNEPAASGDLDAMLWQGLEKRTDMIEGIVTFLQAYVRRTPVLLVIDDLHRIHPYALEVLQEIVRKIKIGKLVILVTYEPTAQFDLGVQPTELTDLTYEETLLMGATILDAIETGTELARVLWERTSGRPLFIESLLRAMQEQDYFFYEQGVVELKPETDVNDLPDNIRQLIISQIDRLSEDARVILRTAAVLDKVVSSDMLPAVNPELSSLELETGLEELVHMQLMKVDEAGLYHFRHGLTQSTVYESLNRFQRQKLHQAAAEYLLKQENEEQYFNQILHHQIRGGVPMRALEFISSIAEKAEESGDINRAIEIYNTGVEIFPMDESLKAEIRRLQEKL